MLDLSPPLSLSIAPLVAGADGVRRAVERARELGYRCVQLSAATQGIRPRELDTRARRDLAALLARHGLALSGLDLMIPPEHWADPAQLDRALSATLAAIALAGDLGRVPLCTALPVASLPADVITELLTAADGHGVALAVHCEQDTAALKTWLDEIDQPLVGAAIDPASLIASGQGPVDTALDLAGRILVARLDDFSKASGSAGNCPVGSGSLKLLNYRAALSTCNNLRSIVADPRNLPDPAAAAEHVRKLWDQSAGPIG